MRIRRPFVIGDALGAGDAGTLPAHLFFLANRAAAADFLGIDQHPLAAARGVDRPQVVAVLVVGAVSEQRDVAAVGRQPGLARRRAIERGTGEHALERDVAGESRRGDGGEKQTGECDAHRPTVRPFAQKKRRSANAPPQLFRLAKAQAFGAFSARVASVSAPLPPVTSRRTSRRSAMRAALPVRPRR